MVQYIYLHDGFDTLLFEQEMPDSYETITDYIEWFTDCYPCLQEWKETMNWTMEQCNGITMIRCETKIEGYNTICIRNTIDPRTLHFPFLPRMTFYQLRTIFSLLLPCIELIFYVSNQDKYYIPKHPFVCLPANSPECLIDTSTEPLSIYILIPKK